LLTPRPQADALTGTGAAAEPKESAEEHLSNKNVLLTCVASVFMGVWFGIAFEKSRVFEPNVIRGQFTFECWIMLKVRALPAAAATLSAALLARSPGADTPSLAPPSDVHRRGGHVLHRRRLHVLLRAGQVHGGARVVLADRGQLLHAALARRAGRRHPRRRHGGGRRVSRDGPRAGEAASAAAAADCGAGAAAGTGAAAGDPVAVLTWLLPSFRSAQVGGGVPSAAITLLGCVAGTLGFGLLTPFLKLDEGKFVKAASGF